MPMLSDTGNRVTTLPINAKRDGSGKRPKGKNPGKFNLGRMMGKDGKIKISPWAPDDDSDSGSSKKRPPLSQRAVAAAQRRKNGKSREQRSSSSYTIKRGDNLTAIAKRNGTTLSALLKANKRYRKNPNLIYAGGKVRIPRG